MRAGPLLGESLSPFWRKRQLYGSAMGLQAVPLRSPLKVVADVFFSRTYYYFSNFWLISISNPA